MVKIDVTGGIKIGGFDYEVDLSEKARRELLADQNCGECDCRNMRITVDCGESDQQISKTFIHEVIEAVNHVYCSDKLEHERIQQLSFGIHQVCESLGVRFGRQEVSDQVIMKAAEFLDAAPVVTKFRTPKQ